MLKLLAKKYCKWYSFFVFIVGRGRTETSANTGPLDLLGSLSFSKAATKKECSNLQTYWSIVNFYISMIFWILQVTMFFAWSSIV